MIYRMLSNEPFKRTYHMCAYAYHHNVFNDEQINTIINLNKDKLSPAKLAPKIGDEPDKNYNEKLRKSDVNFFYKDKDTHWIFNAINHYVDTMNEDFYNFDLNGYESIQYTEYKSADSGHYEFHIDMGLGKPEYELHGRKLSFVVQLTEQNVDFEGGDFEMYLGAGEDKFPVPELKKGSIIIFPSFFLHRVAPVTKGIRRTLVGWVLGPKFK